MPKGTSADFLNALYDRMDDLESGSIESNIEIMSDSSQDQPMLEEELQLDMLTNLLNIVKESGISCDEFKTYEDGFKRDFKDYYNWLIQNVFDIFNTMCEDHDGEFPDQSEFASYLGL